MSKHTYGVRDICPHWVHLVAKHSKHQQKIIKNYYDHRETLALQRAQELITELYLSEGAKRQRYWQQLAGHLSALGVKQAQFDHLTRQDKPELVAELVRSLISK